MIKRFVIKVLSKWFIDAVKYVEKQNYMTKILDLCYLKMYKEIRKNVWAWGTFCEGLQRLLKDASDEVEQAKKWTGHDRRESK